MTGEQAKTILAAILGCEETDLEKFGHFPNIKEAAEQAIEKMRYNAMIDIENLNVNKLWNYMTYEYIYGIFDADFIDSYCDFSDGCLTISAAGLELYSDSIALKMQKYLVERGVPIKLIP